MKIELNINDRIVDFLKSNLKGKRFVLWMGSVIFATSIIVYAAPLVLPYTFSEGTVISADEVNANFKALQDEINILKGDVQAAPTGTIVAFGGDTVPAGWLLCDGSEKDRTGDTLALFQAIGNTWGVGDGINTFNLPDLRGMFLRGAGAHGSLTMANGNYFEGPALGASEDDMSQAHKHQINSSGSHYHLDPGSSYSGEGYYGTSSRSSSTLGALAPAVTLYNAPRTSSNSHTHSSSDFSDTLFSHTTNGSVRYGDETRPVNFGVNYIIKY